MRRMHSASRLGRSCVAVVQAAQICLGHNLVVLQVSSAILRWYAAAANIHAMTFTPWKFFLVAIAGWMNRNIR